MDDFVMCGMALQHDNPEPALWVVKCHPWSQDYLCQSCKDWMWGRFTCPLHGDDAECEYDAERI